MLKGSSIITRKRTDDKTVVPQTGFCTTRTGLIPGCFLLLPRHLLMHLRFLKIRDFSVKLGLFAKYKMLSCYATYMISLRQKNKHKNSY